MKQTDEVFIEITTWMGVSLGATHYYGSLKGYFTNQSQLMVGIELEHKLTQREATKLNKDSGYDFLVWRKGTPYRGFDRKEDIIKIGLSAWKTEFPLAHILVLGKSYSAEPQKILVAPQDYMDKVNAWAKLKPRGDWTPEWDRITNEFWKYHNAYVVEETNV